MMAVRMARAYTGRTKLVKFRDHFHGWHDYVRSHEPAAGGIPAETASTVISIEPNDIGLVERTLEGDKDVAAVIVEPTGAHMGGHAAEAELPGRAAGGDGAVRGRADLRRGGDGVPHV